MIEEDRPLTDGEKKSYDDMHDMMHKIINVINGHPIEVTGLAMITLLVTNSGLDKKTFMEIVDMTWDYHNKESK